MRPGRLELDQPVVAADQVLRYGEAKAGAARAARYERIEDRVLQLGRNARPVVLNLDAGDDAVVRLPMLAQSARVRSTIAPSRPRPARRFDRD